MAYKLQLPEQSQVHPVFHVSQLQRALLPGTPVNSDLVVHSGIPAVPAEVLNQRWSKQRGAMVEQVLVRWSNSAAMADSWEDRVAVQARFPAAEAWGQASAQGRGDVNAPNMPDMRATDHGSSPARTRAARARKANTKVTRPEWVN